MKVVDKIMASMLFGFIALVLYIILAPSVIALVPQTQNGAIQLFLGALAFVLGAFLYLWNKQAAARCPKGGEHIPESETHARARTWTNDFYVVRCVNCGKGLYSVGVPWGARSKSEEND